MKVCFVALIVCTSAQLLADDFIGPCAVFTETARIDRASARYLESVAREYGIEDGKFSTYNRKRITRESSYIQQFRSAKNFVPVFGTAWFVQVKKDGTSTLCRWPFFTVPDKVGARTVAEGEVTRREQLGLTGTKIESRGTGWIVRTSGTTSSEGPGQPVRGMMDLHIACKANVVVNSWARPDAHSLPLKSLAAKARRARGKAWYWHIDPTIVPMDLRKEFVKNIRKEALRSLQRVDSEDSDAYYFRRLLGDNYLDVVSAALLEVEEANAWLSLPTGQRAFRAMAEVRFVDGGRLSKLAKVLGQGREKFKAREDSVLSLAIRCGAPEQIRSLAIAAVAAQPSLVGSPVGGLLLTSAEQRSFEAIFAFGQMESTTLGLSAGLRMKGDTLDSTELRPLLKDSVVKDSHITREQSKPTPYVVGLGMTDGLLTLTATEEAGLHEEIAGFVEQGQGRRSPAVIQLRGNLDQLANHDPESGTGRLLRKAEQAFDKWFIASASRGLLNVVEVSDGSFQSLATKISANGDWTTRGSVRMTKTSARSEIIIGRELARFLTARYIASRNRLLDSFVPGKLRSGWDLQQGK